MSAMRTAVIAGAVYGAATAILIKVEQRRQKRRQQHALQYQAIIPDDHPVWHAIVTTASLPEQCLQQMLHHASAHPQSELEMVALNYEWCAA